MENCESFKSFSFIYIYIYIYNNDNNNNKRKEVAKAKAILFMRQPGFESFEYKALLSLYTTTLKSEL